jgi:hypothetical protein
MYSVLPLKTSLTVFPKGVTRLITVCYLHIQLLRIQKQTPQKKPKTKHNLKFYCDHTAWTQSTKTGADHCKEHTVKRLGLLTKLQYIVHGTISNTVSLTMIVHALRQYLAMKSL